MAIAISVSIFAYNESDLISKTLHSLLQQSLFSTDESQFEIEIIVVPNGCTDDTASVARTTLQTLIEPSDYPHVTWKICELAQAGKSNAWNTSVHQLCMAEAKYLFLMDADIEFLEKDTLISMINVLEKTPEAWVAVDQPIKDVALKTNKTLMEHFSVLISGLSGGKATEEGPAWLCGQLYCGRAEVLQRLWLPTRLPTQDAFLYTMIVTDGLRSEKDPCRVIRAKSASHSFEAYTQLARLLRHEKWLILGSAVNELIYSDLLAEGIPAEGAGSLIKRRNEEDPNWLSKHVQAVGIDKNWLIPSFILLRRFKGLRYQNPINAVSLLPLAVIAFSVDAFLSFQANFELRQGSKLGYWGK